MGIIRAICSSEKRGTEKVNIDKGYFEAGFGLRGDAHGGNWHRQVSLLSADKVDKFNENGADVSPGAFGENIVVEGFDFSTLPVGTRFNCNDVVLEMTQIGKECHTHCQIYHRMGDCIMPREGVFARVLSSGIISVGDELTMDTSHLKDMPYQTAVITLSDRCAKGDRMDESGPVVTARLKKEGFEVVEEIILPDEEGALKKALIRLCDQRQLDLILTTGGTGFAPRDITPEATESVATRKVPGVADAIRLASMAVTPKAMLSRGTSVIRGKTLIVNLPGSPKACTECMDAFITVIPHGLKLLRGGTFDCAEDNNPHGV